MTMEINKKEEAREAFYEEINKVIDRFNKTLTPREMGWLVSLVISEEYEWHEWEDFKSGVESDEL